MKRLPTCTSLMDAALTVDPVCGRVAWEGGLRYLIYVKVRDCSSVCSENDLQRLPERRGGRRPGLLQTTSQVRHPGSSNRSLRTQVWVIQVCVRCRRV